MSVRLQSLNDRLAQQRTRFGPQDARMLAKKQTYAAAMLLLVMIVVLSTGVQATQAVIVGLAMAASMASFARGTLARSLTAFGVVTALGICWALTMFIAPYQVDLFYAAGEWKVIAVLLVPNLVHLLLLSSGMRLGVNDPTDSLVLLFKTYLIVLFLITLITTSLGVPRSSGIFGHSINVSYGLAYLVAYLRKNIALGWKIGGLVPVFLLGSGTGLAVYLLGIVGPSRKNWARTLLLGLGAVAAALVYSQLFRGKDIEGGWRNLDRIQILEYHLQIMKANYEPANWLLGYGPGHEFTQGLSTDILNIRYWFLPDLARNGVFSFGTHNEFLRLYIDFGIGAAIVIAVTLRMFPIEVACLVLLACLTNTTLYHGNNIAILAIIACALYWKDRSIQRTPAR